MPPLPPHQVKDAICHEQQVVREEALRHFADAHSTDPQILPKAIEAVEAYGDDAFGYARCLLRDLVHTDQTLTWSIKRLREPTSDDVEQYNYHLGDLIASADITLLMRHRDRILAAPGLPEEDLTAIEHRIRLTAEPLDRLWDELEAFCDREKDTRYVTDMDLPHAFRLTEAIARHPACADRVLDLIDADLDGDPVASMRNTLACRIAGLMRLEAAVPHLERKLHIDTDWDREQWCEALGRIGTDAVVEAIARDFSAAEWHYRLYASGVLEHLRCPTVVGRSLELAEREQDLDIRANLVIAPLMNFATEGIDPALAVIRQGSSEPHHPLLAVSRLANVDFPERDRWLAEEERRLREQPGRYAALRTLMSLDLAEFDLDDDVPSPLPPPPPVPQIVTQATRTGRNDPCPCGSGRKYKKCCLAVGQVL